MDMGMKKNLATTAVVLGLALISPPTHAQGYVVNGRAASPSEVQLLVKYGAQPGHWLIDGFGISSVANVDTRPRASGNSDRKCWYVLDVLLCE